MKKRKKAKKTHGAQIKILDELAGPTRTIGELRNQIAYINSKISRIDERLLFEKNKDQRQKLIFEKNSLIRDENFKATDLRRQEILIGKLKEKAELEKKEIEQKKKMQQIEKQIEKRGKSREQAKNNRTPIVTNTNSSKNAINNVTTSSKDLYTERVIEWKNVRFLDGAIFFELSFNHFSNHFKCNISRQSYNFLKKYFVYKKLSPLKVRFRNNNPVEVTNIEELKTVFEILEIENYIYFEYSASGRNRLKLSRMGLNKNNICKIYQLFSKSVFFDHLIRLQDDHYKVIPIPEVILDESGRIIKAEDSFIFSFVKRNVLFLIWESVIEKKATYVFRSTSSSYENSIQKLFDYISSPEIKNKRETLIYDYQPKNYLNFNTRILHTIPSDWINNLKML